MIPWLKRMVSRADMVACAHTDIRSFSLQLEQDAKSLAEALRQSGKCAAYVDNKEDIGRKYQKLFERVIIIALAFNLDIKTEGGISDDT